MPSAIAESLDSLAAWREALDREMAALGRSLLDHELLDDADAAVLHALRERLAADKLVLAFVAEFSRGKSELINAIFFADAGRRVLPATPGRTTMCPVELRFDAHLPPRLALLPIETRLRGLSLTELRPRENEWHHVALDPGNADSLADALAAVTQTQRVSVDQAAKLGLWNEAQPDDNPQQAADGSVEVPAWRHAVINYPHPLLQRGLVVMDTPGLNAVGAEPELTLGLLPSAHAVVFVLAADTGVTKSDLAIWRDHLGQASLERFVVLNKIDTLADPLLTVDAVQVQIEQQCLGAAALLKVPRERVFALSAREALSARVGHSGAGLVHSRLPPLEQALALELLPKRRELLVASAVGTIEHLRASGSRRLADRRRLQTEQLLELRGLRGKSVGKLRMMLERIDAEITEFERCTVRIAALRSVQQRVLRGVLEGLSSDALRKELLTLQSPGILRSFSVGGRTAFDALMVRLRQTVATALAQADELRQMFEGSFRELNSGYGFALVLSPLPSLAAFDMELHLIARNYSRYLGIGQAWRMAAPGFAEQFRRMLLSKLRVCFESAAGEVELWSKAALTQIEVQLRERRRGFVRRRESLQRVQSASGELEQRIAEVQAHDAQIDQMQNRLDRLVAQAASSARGLTQAEPDSGVDEYGYAQTAPADLQQQLQLRLRAPA